MAARRIFMGAARWAVESGLDLRRAAGQEAITWPGDGSAWVLSSGASVYGHSASVACADECWDLPVEIVESALTPTLVERVQSQLWLFSTANDACTGLMPSYRKRALDGDGRTMIAEWSAPPDADHSDPAVWRAASAHWSDQRAELMGSAKGSPAFKSQWLNSWASDGEQARPEWPEGFSRCDRAPVFTPTVAAIEVSAARDRFGVAGAARTPDGRIAVTCSSADSLEGAMGLLTALGVPAVLAGVSLRDSVPGPWTIIPTGQKETRSATPIMQDLVRRGALAHDHDPVLMAESRGARTVETESGPMLSGRKSEGSISCVKAVTWACWAVETGVGESQVEIW